MIFKDKNKKVGFMDKCIESKNFSKEKTKIFFIRPVPHYGKNKYISTDVDLVEDIKSNKRKNNSKDLLSELQLLVKNGNLGIKLKKR